MHFQQLWKSRIAAESKSNDAVTFQKGMEKIRTILEAIEKGNMKKSTRCHM